MQTHAPRLAALAICGSVLLACNLGQPPTAPIPAAPTGGATPSAAPQASVNAEAIMATRPLVWFAPLPPMPQYPGREFIGSQDFMSLFEPDAPWEMAASHIQVFKLYGEWVGGPTRDSDLGKAVQDIQRRGMALAVEAGPLDPPADCGQGVEGFAGKAEGLRIARRIAAVGGTLDVIALDEPYFFAHAYDGPNACHWPVDKVAAEVGAYIQAVRSVVPGVIVGDTEPLAGTTDAAAYADWLDTFKRVNGYDLAFLHMDVDWGRSTWPQEVKAIADHGSHIGVPVGIIYFGNGFEATDEAWLAAAGERVKKYELEAGGVPDHVLFQSWNDKPDFVLPESKPFTWTNFIDAYFTDKAALGYKREGAGADVALGKSVTVSGAIPRSPGTQAVDADLGTLWNSGGGPVQWIEIDLGGPKSIQSFRLTVAQDPAGGTTHRVLTRGVSGDFQLVQTFSGNTKDGDVLTYAPPQPLPDIQFIRIETTESPSWVAWREIEVIAAE
jgi:hypothetical protein